MMTTYSVGDAVVLVDDVVDEGLKKGQVGAVVMAFDQPTIAYEIEFCDSEGRTIAQIALLPEQLGPYKRPLA